MILCCGEAVIDLLPAVATTGQAAYVPHSGGAAFNTAIALGRLGAPVGLVSALSGDAFGRMLRRGLEQSGVCCDLVVDSPRRTTLAIVTLEKDVASYIFHDDNTAVRMLRAGDLPRIPDSVSTLLFGGISLAQEPCGTAFETLMQRAAPGRVVMLDPNIRPASIEEEPVYRARLERMIARADIVKLSEEDLHWLLGPISPNDAATEMLRLGPKLAVVTLGAKGALGQTAKGSVFVPAPSVAVADTVGAGDTFNAGLLCALHRAGAREPQALEELAESHLRSAINLGVLAAAVTVGRPGANPPRAHELP